MNKLAKMNGQEIESIKDINSQEMVLEDAGAGGSTEHHKIVGGGQQIEDDEHELHEDDEDGAEYLGAHQNNMRVEYRGNDDGIIDLK